MTPTGGHRVVHHACPKDRLCYHITARDLDVLELLAKGITSHKDLARRLNLNHSTIKGRISHMLAMFGVQDRMQLVLKAHREQIITLPRRTQIRTASVIMVSSIGAHRGHGTELTSTIEIATL